MKKLKVILMSVAIVGAVSGAFATKPTFNCFNEQQYHFIGGQYLPVDGDFGTAYGCQGAPVGTCTYWFNGSSFQPCRLGTYTPL